MRPTIKSIANQLGISHATVSMALRDHPLVKEETKQRIKLEAAKLGYVPNGIAQAMRQSRSSTVGVIVGNMGNSFTGMVVEAIENEVKKRGYRCLICQTHESPSDMEQEIRVLEKHRSAGLIIQALNFEMLEEIYKRTLLPTIPCVFCDGYVPGYPASAVVSDNRSLGFMATQHLIELGHRRIACLLGPDRNAQDRFQGYSKALKKASLKLDENLVISGGWGFEEGVRTAQKLLSRKVSFTGVVASSDPVAVGAMEVLAKAGFRVPSDISVMGAGNHDFGYFVTPPLTSIEQYPEKIGKYAVDLLFERINHPNTGFVRRLIKPRLIARESTARRKS